VTQLIKFKIHHLVLDCHIITFHKYKIWIRLCTLKKQYHLVEGLNFSEYFLLAKTALMVALYYFRHCHWLELLHDVGKHRWC